MIFGNTDMSDLDLMWEEIEKDRKKWEDAQAADTQPSYREDTSGELCICCRDFYHYAVPNVLLEDGTGGLVCYRCRTSSEGWKYSEAIEAFQASCN